MTSPNQSTIDHLRSAVSALDAAARPLDAGDTIKDEIAHERQRVEGIIYDLERLRDYL